MKERGILFSAPMVRALLEGRKTQTRRLITPQPRRPLPGNYGSDDAELWLWNKGHSASTRTNIQRTVTEDAKTGRELSDVTAHLSLQEMLLPHCPYGVPGDRLWMRETWGFVQGAGVRIVYRADGTPQGRFRGTDIDGMKWISPLFLKRVNSRITLEVTEVRVQRLQEISKEDAIAEGATRRDGKHGGGWSMDWSRVGQHSRFAAEGPGPLTAQDVCLGTARMAFGRAWEDINGKRAPWDSNPWVWAITFKVIA